MARPALSAARGVQVLNFLSAHSTEPFTLSDLVRRIGVNVASMHAILHVLEEAGYVVRDADRRTYELGPMLVPVGHAALARNPTISAARRELEGLVDDTGVVGIVVGATATEMVILDEVSPVPPRVPSLGQRIRMIPPLGAVFYAWRDDAAIDEWLASAGAGAGNDAPAPDGAELRDWLRVTRARGYVVGHENPARSGLRQALRELQEEPGSRRARGALRRVTTLLGDLGSVVVDLEPDETYSVSHIGAPVFDAAGAVTLALYVVGLREPRSGREVRVVAERVRDTAAAVTKSAGGRVLQ